MASSSAKVTLGPELQRAVTQLVRDVAGDVVDIVESISDDIATGARDDWYDYVRRKSGRSGEANDYRLEIKGNAIRGVVYNDAEQEQRSRNKSEWKLTPYGGQVRPRRLTGYGYFVHRPGPLSRVFRGLNAAQYSEAMAYWREHGQLPEGYKARSMTDGKGRKRPVGISKVTVNPAHADGKTLWKVLVLDRYKRMVDDRLPDLDKALQASADRFSR